MYAHYFYQEEDIQKITDKTAGVLLENNTRRRWSLIEPENGLPVENQENVVNEVGALLILDEIQPGIWTNQESFCLFETLWIVSDILVIGKGMAGGLPAGRHLWASQDANAKAYKTVQN